MRPGPKPVERERAVVFLRSNLTPGPRSARYLLDLAAEAQFSSKVIQAAKKALRIRVRQHADGWWWYLPEHYDRWVERMLSTQGGNDVDH
jgi:hypothetical protein